MRDLQLDVLKSLPKSSEEKAKFEKAEVDFKQESDKAIVSGRRCRYLSYILLICFP